MAKDPSFKKQEENRGESLRDYWPLTALILIAAAVGFALVWPLGGGWWIRWMHYFMGFFLSAFAMLKIFHLSAFADGFEMYDLIAKRFHPYGYIYPFIELGLGLAYFGFFHPATTYILTIIVMTIGAVGVVRALKRGLDINCPCMGSVLDVPLSTVTLTEDIGMGLMAAVMLFMRMGG
ncbi:MAG: MauE/DoxX family redox-associated membrane protein [Pseudomonadota bacterium]